MKKNLNRQCLVLLFCLTGAILVTGGCKKKEEPPKAPQVQAAAQPPVQPKPAPPVQKPLSTAKASTPAGVSLNFKAKKDPFKPLITAPDPSAAKAPAPVKLKIVDALPIQTHETTKFTVTGIITGLRENKALIIDPLGKGYVVKTGMLIGSGGGSITKITANSLEVSEPYADEKNRKKMRKIVLPLAKKSKETSR